MCTLPKEDGNISAKKKNFQSEKAFWSKRFVVDCS